MDSKTENDLIRLGCSELNRQLTDINLISGTDRKIDITFY